jgi:hypothetical protein
LGTRRAGRKEKPHQRNGKKPKYAKFHQNHFRKETSLSNETERNIEAGAGIEPANRFTLGEAILLRKSKKQVTTLLTSANVVTLL